ncbi:MAG: radical SAM protein [Anaerolineae bacterium]|nr:radical SAM protein [Anaerolineae bacterium]
MPSPRSVDIAITGRCNLRCQYCFYADEMVALGDLPTATWLKFFDELGAAGVLRATLTGGEVFTRPDFFELLDGLIANRMRYSLLSNGTLITEKTLAQFEQGKRRARLDSIQISIDGSCAEVHDGSRPNSFNRAIRGLRLLKEAGYPLVVRTTINKRNLHDLENVAALLLDEIGMRSFTTNEVMPLGAGCHYEANMVLSADEQLEAMDIIARLDERYPGRIQSQSGPQAKNKAYAEMEHARRTGEQATDWVMGYLTGCGCVFHRMSILHNGTLVPCHIMYDAVLGNFQTDSIIDIWQNHPIMNQLRDRRAIPMHEAPGCQACEWNQQCNGGCPGLAYQLTGDFNRANPADCYRRFLADLSEESRAHYYVTH